MKTGLEYLPLHKQTELANIVKIITGVCMPEMIILFGSYARGDFNEKSDIDILVDFNGSIGIKFISLAHELEDIFNTKIDLVSRKGIKPKYLPYVEKTLINV